MWEHFRRQMPITRRWAYFDHAAVAPISQPAREAIERWTGQAADDGVTQWSQWSREIERTRDLAASMVGADRDEIALVANTTAGISLIAEGYPWADGDNVVTLSNEFPSNLYPWLNLQSRGVETRRVPVDGGRVDLDRVAQACDRRTRIISVSWVGYATGWRLDVDRFAQIARQSGALFFLDAIQGLGVFPLDVRRSPVDFLAADGHKWLLGPEGAGILYIRREQLPRLRALGVGWNSVVHRSDFSHIALDLRPEAGRYEGGSQNMVGFIGLGASLKLLAELGVSKNQSPVADRVLQITDICCERLEQAGARIVSHRDKDSRSGIVSFEVPGTDPDVVKKRCLEQGVVISCRGGRPRISPHAYINEEDIDRLVVTIARHVRG